MPYVLTPQPLTRASFAPFGDVIETQGCTPLAINDGFAERFHDLARLEVAAEGGRALVSIFRGQPRPSPLRLAVMERHPLASQAFFPLHDRDWLVVVAAGPDPVAGRALRAFRAGGRQGVQYGRNVWHHPLLVLVPDHEFLVVDRDGPGDNLEEVSFATPAVLVTDQQV